MSRFNTILCGASVSAIAWYQVRLSPRKGYSCAYRVKTGGESCSQFARRAFESGDWWPALQAVIERFHLCGEAARALRGHQRTFLAKYVHDEDLDGAPTEQKSSSPQITPELICAKCTGETVLQCCFPACVSSVCGA